MMADILFIKTSSLGDVIHHMPAVTEARKAPPGRALHLAGGGGFRAAGAPCIRRSARSSRWPGGAGASRFYRAGDVGRDRRAACAPSARSATTRSSTARACCAPALIARIAHGRRHGYDAQASASRWPRCSTTGATASAAICMRSTRNRMLSGLALGYTPQGAPDFGLDRARFRRGRRALCRAAACHRAAEQAMAGGELDRARQGARSRASSNWCCPGARATERARSERIAAALPRARVPERAPLDDGRAA